MSASVARWRSVRSIGFALASVTLLCAASAEAVVYKGKARGEFSGDPQARVRIQANDANVTFFKPRNFKLRCTDGTSGRADDNNAINASRLPLEERANGRKRFGQHLSLTDPEDNQVKVDIFGSFNATMNRARGRFRIRVIQAEGGESPAGTKCTTGYSKWRAKRV